MDTNPTQATRPDARLSDNSWRIENLTLAGQSGGQGRVVLYLHAENGPDTDAPALGMLAATHHLVAPAHPGFGTSDLDPDLTHVSDLALLYLELIARQGWRDVLLVGVSFGAWIAAEMASFDQSRLAGLVLADAVGIKISERTVRDIVDIFALTEPELRALAWADPARGARDLTALDIAQVTAIARARESTARYGWTPYLHNPRLRRRLRRIRLPTQVLWGAQDRIVTPDYGRAFAAGIPGANFALIDDAGHYPQLEQPAAFAHAVNDFAAHLPAIQSV